MGNCITPSKYKDTNNLQKTYYCVDDFKFIKLLGKGGFGKVWKVQQKNTGQIYAMKIMEKAQILEKRSVKAILQQRKIHSRLTEAGINFIANIHAAFQDNEKLYLLIDYLQGNTLRHHLNCGIAFSQIQIKLMIRTIVKTFQNLYEHNIIHGDLKPQNILFDKQGVPFLTDFGSASYIKNNNSDQNSGTIGYMAPEVMQEESHNFTADYYALGVITFQLFIKKRPFQSRKRQDLLKQIRKKPLNTENFPQLKTMSNSAQDFIINLLQRRPQNRLGFTDGIHEIMNHPWLNDLSEIDIVGELIKMKKIFQFEITSNFSIVDQRDQPRENLQKYLQCVNRLNLCYVQEMFCQFNYAVPSQKGQTTKKNRKSSSQIVQLLSQTHWTRKSLEK